MKNWLYIFGLILLFSCDSENASDCFQTAGNNIQEEFFVPNFEKILVNRDIELIIKQGPSQQVVVQTGGNLINDVVVEVIDNQLVLTDNNTCNYVRDFGITKVFVTTPNLNEIRCSTQFEIKSEGVLSFNNLALLSEDFNVPDTFPIGDFRLNLDVENLRVVSNNLSFFSTLVTWEVPFCLNPSPPKRPRNINMEKFESSRAKCKVIIVSFVKNEKPI